MTEVAANEITVLEPTSISRFSQMDEQAINALVGNVAKTSQRIYRHDCEFFLNWLVANNLTITTATFDELTAYRSYLDSATYQTGKDNTPKPLSKNTKARRLVVARRLLEVAVIKGLRSDNPARYVKGFGGVAQETPRRVLTAAEARDLMSAIDRTTLKGKRDYALLLVLIRTGIRRAECAALTIGDMAVQQGHNILRIRHGKGDKARIVKLPVEVRRALVEYLEATGRQVAGDNAPLFVRFGRWDKPKTTTLDGLDIERIVEAYGKQAGISELTPHGMRASFVTLALEGGAKLEQVQYAAGHSDPRTTERYQKRKLNLDNNAVDFVRF